MKKIISVTVLDGYKLKVKFDDGIEGVADLSHLAGKGVFTKFNDPLYFKQVRIDPETDTLAWPDNLDICPDSLYEEITGRKIFGSPDGDERRIA